MLPIKGLQKLSLIDYEPYSSCIVYVGGCNFRCPFCQNAELVLNKGEGIEEQEIMQFLRDRKGWIDAVVITGGEPTLYKDLLGFVRRVKALGYRVKLDTNGTNPELLDKLLEHVDYVAMDIKARPEAYPRAANAEVDMGRILKSIRLIKEKAKDYEFRTTVVPALFRPDDAEHIGRMIRGAKRYCMQQFRTDMGTLDPDVPKETYCRESFEDLKKRMEEFAGEVILRGV